MTLGRRRALILAAIVVIAAILAFPMRGDDLSMWS